jgi:hypothetical protein
MSDATRCDGHSWVPDWPCPSRRRDETGRRGRMVYDAGLFVYFDQVGRRPIDEGGLVDLTGPSCNQTTQWLRQIAELRAVSGP